MPGWILFLESAYTALNWMPKRYYCCPFYRSNKIALLCSYHCCFIFGDFWDGETRCWSFLFFYKRKGFVRLLYYCVWWRSKAPISQDNCIERQNLESKSNVFSSYTSSIIWGKGRFCYLCEKGRDKGWNIEQIFFNSRIWGAQKLQQKEEGGAK